MSFVTPATFTLADAIHAIETRPELGHSARRRIEIARDIRIVAGWLDREPAEVPASIHALQHRLKDLHHGPLGISKGRFRNVLSNLRRGLEAVRVHDRSLAPITIGMYLHEVAVWASVIWQPECDWTWLKRFANSYKHERRSRNMAARTASTHDLVRLGRRLTTRAQALPPTTQAAILFRDGLMIALLALRPIRLSNLVDLTLGESLLVHNDGATIVLEETKNGCPYSDPVPDDLVAHLHRYLEVYRPVLLGGNASTTRTRRRRCSWSAPPGRRPNGSRTASRRARRPAA